MACGDEIQEQERTIISTRAGWNYLDVDGTGSRAKKYAHMINACKKLVSRVLAEITVCAVDQKNDHSDTWC